ncbi:MAG TPA: methyltransferase domain-containing protein [Longimicrobium sp.]|jgi:predicted nicotinamide N-methyase|uniref:class I SAM-dependent methyltransferase n=1 Tax=Longimicrobium sp. TaxID=2029185 RepID=UPI002ED8DCCB
MTGSLEAELRARFDVREERFEHGGWGVELILPRAADELIDEAEFEGDERLPYWAELWPSARALARYLLENGSANVRECESARVDDWTGLRVLELGCGVALPSLVLAARGAGVLATDWYDDALRFARANAERNGLPPLQTELLDWRQPRGGWGYDLVIAADVLYEPRNGPLLTALFPRVVAPGGTVLIADPGRVYAGDFLRLARGEGWSVDEAAVRMEPSAAGAESRVRIHRLRRADGG